MYNCDENLMYVVTMGLQTEKNLVEFENFITRNDVPKTTTHEMFTFRKQITTDEFHRKTFPISFESFCTCICYSNLAANRKHEFVLCLAVLLCVLSKQ